ncbi:MAG: glycosyltransferase, partial [Candidatus Methanomethyliaceae archaeon]
MGGIENYLVRLPDYLPSDIQLYYSLVYERGILADKAEHKGVQILPVPSQPPKWMPEIIYFSLNLSKFLPQINPHIIHSHLEQGNSISIIANFVARCKAFTIAHLHSPRSNYCVRGSLQWQIEKIFLPRYDLILNCSDFVRCVNMDFYHLPPEKTRVLYCGIHLEPFQELPEKESSRAQLGLEKDVPVLVFVGRLSLQHKGLDILLQAAAKLVEGGEEFVLLLVGPGEEAR